MKQPSVPKVVPSRHKIEVTAENIQDACKADSRHCMIADAIAQQLPGVRSISVDMMTIRWSDPAKGWRYIYLTPKPAQKALIDYDMGEQIAPFNFQVRSGHAVPMILGSGKSRKRAHQVTKSKILKVTDKTIVQSVGRDAPPMWPGKNIQKSKGRPREWHPSHNSLREFGMRGFTEGYMKIKTT
jgi:hypothetical protein